MVRHPQRDNLQKYLADKGIQTISDAYSSATPAVLPVAEHLAKHVLSIPIGPHLQNHQVEFVAATLKAF